MKILVIGLGSQGKKRIRTLKLLGECNVIGFDIDEDRADEIAYKFHIRTFIDFENAMKECPGVFFICTPPDMHYLYQLYACSKCIDFFTEASVIDEGLKEIIELVKENRMIGVPSGTMRFCPEIISLKKIVDRLKPSELLTFTYHCGSYLPAWHPYEPLRASYFSKKVMGGAKEKVCFELCWLTWVFGGVKSVSALIKNNLNFGDGIDDVYQIILTFKSGLIGHILINVVSRDYYRHLTLLTKDSVINRDIFVAFDSDVYTQETAHFLKAVRWNVKYHYSLQDDLNILNLLAKIHESNDKHKQIDVKYKL